MLFLKPSSRTRIDVQCVRTTVTYFVNKSLQNKKNSLRRLHRLFSSHPAEDRTSAHTPHGRNAPASSAAVLSSRLAPTRNLWALAT